MDHPAVRAVCQALEALDIRFELHAHPPVFTVDEALTHWRDIDATHCKNLFLRNKKGSRHYLLVAAHSREVDLKRIAGVVGDDRLSFASPERLNRLLGLTPGSVSPFGLLNDTSREVRVVVDAGLRGSRRVGFHPNVNTATLVLSTADFERFLASTGHVVQFVTI